MSDNTVKKQKKLPIGIQSFAKLRENNCYYVDKTELLIQLAQESAVFLSRPRRFGKSITLDTLAELFSGNKALFTGLYAENNWDWETTYSIIRISFGTSQSFNLDLVNRTIEDHIIKLEKKFNIIPDMSTITARFANVIEQCHQSTNQKVVILIDEYDKPMLDALHSDEIIQIRDTLRSFYSVIKDTDAHIHFSMLTGVSKFSKVNMFSGLNSLHDITLNHKYSSLCGYSQKELEGVFSDRLEGVDLDMVKLWYNGYNWTGESVYNPFDILLFLENGKQFRPYWSETGNPTFLIDTLFENQTNLFDIIEQTADDGLLANFDVGSIEPTALMFQTGYLTIDKVINDPMRGTQFTLKYPNHEVRQSINKSLINKYISNQNLNLNRKQNNLYKCLTNNDFDKLQTLFSSLFASIPHDWYRNNNIAHYEGYWASVFYSFFASAGFDIRCEDSTNLGRVDMTVQYLDNVYIFEFKVVEKIDEETKEVMSSLPLGSAIKQIRERDYAKKYASDGKLIYLFGVEFSEKARNVLNFEWEAYEK